MAERDYVKELEGLKTSLMGYDRESVMAYIRDLIVEKDAEREDALKEMSTRQMQLAAENAGLRAEIETRKLVYEQLAKRVDQMNVSMDKMESYARERDHALENYHIREQEMSDREFRARERYDIDLELIRLREKKRKRKIWGTRCLTLLAVWILCFVIFGISVVQGDSMRPAYHQR